MMSVSFHEPITTANRLQSNSLSILMKYIELGKQDSITPSQNVQTLTIKGLCHFHFVPLEEVVSTCEQLQCKTNQIVLLCTLHLRR